ncbi:MAG: hypothetical protein WCL30_04160 [Pseudomonadota bacterium]
MNSQDSEDSQGYNKQEDPLEQMIKQAVAAAGKGENIEHLLEVLLLTTTSNKEKDKIRKRFASALVTNKIREPKENSDIPPRNVLSRLQALLAVPAKMAYDKVVNLMRSRPDLEQVVKQAGDILARNGVSVEKIRIAEAELGTIQPSSGISSGQAKPGQSTSR